MNKPLVSIACITYNHEQYIKDAIEGFLSQETSFDYEIIIHDDASSDRTADIIKQYEARYPDKIHGIYQRENQLSKLAIGGNMLQDFLYPVCRGKYIALCEGDDFWIDPKKLQLQVDYMEGHPECVAACHDAVCINYKDFTVYPIHPYLEERYLTNEEVIIQYHGDVPTASMLYRRDVVYMEGFFTQSGLGDYSHELYAITKGKIYFLPRIMSVYRSMHEGSWCRTHNENIRRGLLLNAKAINFLRQYDVYTNRKYHDAIIYKELIFIDHSAYICRNLNGNEIEKMIRYCNEKTDNQYKDIYMRVESVYKQKYMEDYYPVWLGEFAERYAHIYIWGAGKYGQRVARQLLHNNKEFEAFIVSEPSGQSVMGKPIIGLDEIPYSIENMGIIIAVSIRNWGEIREDFKRNGQFHYMYPYGGMEAI